MPLRNCTALTLEGEPCRFATKEGDDLCINHAPGNDNAERGRRGSKARAAAIARKPSAGLLHATFSFSDRTSIQAVIDTVVRLLISSRVDYKTGSLVLRYCNAAIRNFDLAGRSLDGPKPQHHDTSAYFRKVEALLQTIDPVLLQALEQDTTEREESE